MYACEYLARVGFDALLRRVGESTVPDWVLDEGDNALIAAHGIEASQEGRRRVRAELLGARPEPRPGGALGAKWLGVISWPDRLPGLKTWAGQSTLPKIIAAHQRRLATCDAGDLFEARGVYRTSKGEGPSGLDGSTCRDAIDIGFSPSALGMDVECRPAIELLAILGLETVPLLSFAPRVCGFVHAGKLWKFPVEQRDGGYYYRWGETTEACAEEQHRVYA
jgi:hypothetical protein